MPSAIVRYSSDTVNLILLYPISYPSTNNLPSSPINSLWVNFFYSLPDIFLLDPNIIFQSNAFCHLPVANQWQWCVQFIPNNIFLVLYLLQFFSYLALLFCRLTWKWNRLFVLCDVMQWWIISLYTWILV